MDLRQMLIVAQQIQDHLDSAQQELADAEVEGTRAASWWNCSWRNSSANA